MRAALPESSFLRSRVGRRIFLQFVLCALLPITLLWAVSSWYLSEHLVSQSSKRLGQSAKSSGMEILGRDALARQDLPGRPVREMLHDYLWSIQFTISGGTSQVQRNIIAERILGLPREPRV